MGLNNRQIAILFEVIAVYVDTAEPVASSVLVDRGAIDASGATIRNEMAALETEGYLIQPYTSAGRIPTPAAYELYVEFVRAQQRLVAARRVVAFARLIREVAADLHLVGRVIARAIAVEARQAVIIGIAHGDAYATGLSYVVIQPEFQDAGVLRAFTAGFDDLHESVARIDARLDDEASVIVGGANPFGAQCSTVARRFEFPEGLRMTVGITGPMRMAYDEQLGLLSAVHEATQYGTSSNTTTR